MAWVAWAGELGWWGCKWIEPNLHQMPCVYAATPARLQTKLKRQGMRRQDAEGAKVAQRTQKNTKIFKRESRARPHQTQRKYQKVLQAVFMRVAGHLWAARRMEAGCLAVWLWWIARAQGRTQWA